MKRLFYPLLLIALWFTAATAYPPNDASSPLLPRDACIPGYTGQSVEDLQRLQDEIVGIDALKEMNYDGSGRGVFILDTGISPTADAVRQVRAFRDFVGSCTQENPCDGNSHGTFVADIIHRIAPRADLIIGRVLDHHGHGSPEILLEALRWGIDHREEYNIKVINMSFGITDHQSGVWSDADELREIIREATEVGIHVVVAVGNESQSLINVAPANSPQAITVGSINHHFTRSWEDDRISDFTNLGLVEVVDVRRSSFLFWETIERDHLLAIPKPDVLAQGEWVVGEVEPDTEIYTKALQLTELERAETTSEILDALRPLLPAGFETSLQRHFSGLERGLPRDLREQFQREERETVLYDIVAEIRESILRMSSLRLLTSQVALLSGTSFSAPIVSGGILLVDEALPHFSPSDLKKSLIASSQPPFTRVSGGTHSMGGNSQMQHILFNQESRSIGVFNAYRLYQSLLSSAVTDSTLVELILDNNDYDLELSLQGEEWVGHVHFSNDGRGQLSLVRDDSEDPQIHFEWFVSQHSNDLGDSLFLAQFERQGEYYLLIGTVAGSYDIDIEGIALRRRMERLSDLSLESRKLTSLLEEEPVGNFHFDD